MDALSGIIRDSLIVTALLCFPVLLVATLVGTLVAIAQAATQIQEQTLTLLPKLIAVASMCAACGTFGLGLCANLFNEIVNSLRDIVR